MLIMIGINIQVTSNVTTYAHRGFLLKANTIFFLKFPFCLSLLLNIEFKNTEQFLA